MKKVSRGVESCAKRPVEVLRMTRKWCGNASAWAIAGGSAGAAKSLAGERSCREAAPRDRQSGFAMIADSSVSRQYGSEERSDRQAGVDATMYITCTETRKLKLHRSSGKKTVRGPEARVPFVTCTRCNCGRLGGIIPWPGYRRQGAHTRRLGYSSPGGVCAQRQERQRQWVVGVLMGRGKGDFRFSFSSLATRRG